VAAGRARARLFTWRGVAETWLGLMAAADGVPVQASGDKGAAAATPAVAGA